MSCRRTRSNRRPLLTSTRSSNAPWKPAIKPSTWSVRTCPKPFPQRRDAGATVFTDQVPSAFLLGMTCRSSFRNLNRQIIKALSGLPREDESSRSNSVLETALLIPDCEPDFPTNQQPAGNASGPTEIDRTALTTGTHSNFRLYQSDLHTFTDRLEYSAPLVMERSESLWSAPCAGRSR